MSALSFFLLFAQVSLLTFGGGYAMVPLFQHAIVFDHSLMAADDFANLVAIAQITPGPIGLNSATFSGFSNAGLVGSLMASLGVLVPSLTITLAVAACLSRFAAAQWPKTLLKWVRPCVVGIIASAVVFFADTSVFTTPFADSLLNGRLGICPQGAVIFAMVMFIRLKWPKLGPIWSLLLSAILGWALFL